MPMSKAANRLTAREIETLVRKRVVGRHHDGRGLLLQITKSGSASWLLRYQRDGRERSHGLGGLHTVSLADARKRAKAARLKVLDGEDPIDAKRAKRQQTQLDAAKATTFREAAERFMKVNETEWKNKVHRQQWHRSLEKHVYPVIGDLPVAAIDRDLVLKVLEPIWHKVTGKRLRNRIEKVLDWAGYRLDKPLPKPPKTPKGSEKHHAAMPYVDVPGFLTELRDVEGNAARALEVTVLTALRTGEVLGGRWAEIDLTKREWTIPAGRMKTGVEHHIPLSPRVVEILADLPRMVGNPFVFVGAREGQPIGARSMFSLMATMRPGLTVHGLRSTFTDWCHERTTVDTIVPELALAHTVGTETHRAYRRTDLFDKRRELMDRWAQFCMNPEATGEVLHGPWAGSAS